MVLPYQLCKTVLLCKVYYTLLITQKFYAYVAKKKKYKYLGYKQQLLQDSVLVTLLSGRHTVRVSYAGVAKGGAVGIEHLELSKWANAKFVP